MLHDGACKRKRLPVADAASQGVVQCARKHDSRCRRRGARPRDDKRNTGAGAQLLRKVRRVAAIEHDELKGDRPGRRVVA